MRCRFLLCGALALAACKKTPEEPAPAASTRGAATILVPPAAPGASVVPAPVTVATCPIDPEHAPPLVTTYVSFDSGARLDVELAKTSHETERGLMYRTSMPENHGMLFRLGRRSDHAFWMHNTCMSLDMLFLDDDGTIVGILEEVPILNDDPRSVGKLSTYVLEVNAGWCKRHGVGVGQKVPLPAGAK